jgi:hypothetical protein
VSCGITRLYSLSHSALATRSYPEDEDPVPGYRSGTGSGDDSAGMYDPKPGNEATLRKQQDAYAKAKLKEEKKAREAKEKKKLAASASRQAGTSTGGRKAAFEIQAEEHEIDADRAEEESAEARQRKIGHKENIQQLGTRRHGKGAERALRAG